MQVEILKGIIRKGKDVYKAGSTMDTEETEAASLIALGMAKPARKAPTAPASEVKKGGDEK